MGVCEMIVWVIEKLGEGCLDRTNYYPTLHYRLSPVTQCFFEKRADVVMVYNFLKRELKVKDIKIKTIVVEDR